MPRAVKYTKTIHVNMTAKLYERLSAIAAKEGVNIVAVIRRLITLGLMVEDKQ